MATTTLKPNGDGSGGSWQRNTGSTYYELIDEGIAGADDVTTYVYEGSSETSLFCELEATPGDFASASAVQVSARIQRTTSKGDSQQLYIQVFESDELTSITDEINFPPAVGFSTVSDSSFSITGTNTKSSWDGAKVRFRSTGTNGLLEVSAVEVILTYTPTGGGITHDRVVTEFLGGETNRSRQLDWDREASVNAGLADAVNIGVLRMLTVTENLGMAKSALSDVIAGSALHELTVTENLALTDGGVSTAVNYFNLVVTENLGFRNVHGPPDIDAPTAIWKVSLECNIVFGCTLEEKQFNPPRGDSLRVLAGRWYRR